MVDPGGRPSRAGAVLPASSPSCRRAPIAWNCPCRKASTNASPAASRSSCRNWNGRTRSATTPCLSRIAAQTGGTYYMGMPALLGKAVAAAAGRTAQGPHQRPAHHRRPRSAVGADVAALADDRVVQLVVFGMVDPATCSNWHSNDEKGRIRTADLGPRRAGDTGRPAPAHPRLRLARGVGRGRRPGWGRRSGSAWPSIGSSSRRPSCAA